MECGSWLGYNLILADAVPHFVSTQMVPSPGQDLTKFRDSLPIRCPIDFNVVLCRNYSRPENGKGLAAHGTAVTATTAIEVNGNNTSVSRAELGHVDGFDQFSISISLLD
ncbi:unnamed protein product [Caretta caretta]